MLHADSLPASKRCWPRTPRYAVVDLKLRAGHGPGLRAQPARGQRSHAHRRADGLRQHCHPPSRPWKLGACHYLAKALEYRRHRGRVWSHQKATPSGAHQPRQLDQDAGGERIHEVLAETGFNISEAARRLGMHRRTLTRKLDKRQVS